MPAELAVGPAPVNADWIGHRRTLARYGSRLALVVSRGGAVGLQFGTQLVVAALAGASGLGVLQLFTAWTCMAGEVLALGLPTQAMRRVAIAHASGDAPGIERLLRLSSRKILAAWLWLLLAAPALGALLFWHGGPTRTDYLWLLAATAVSAPLFALLRLYCESLKACGATLWAISLENLTSPLVLLLVCGGCWLAGEPVLALTLVMACTVGTLIAPLALRLALRQQLGCLPPGDQPDAPAVPAPRAELLYLWGNSVLGIAFLQLPFLVLPVYVDTAEIGVFAIAHKLINVVTTCLLLLAAVYAPAFARAAARRDSTRLRVLLRRTQLISSAVFIPAALILVVLAGPLAALFGEEFTELRTFLLILAGGHLVNAATGLCGVLLTMAGAAARELATLVLALLAAVAGSAWAGPQYGAIGLALVFSASIALKHLASYVVARQLLKPTGEPT